MGRGKWKVSGEYVRALLSDLWFAAILVVVVAVGAVAFNHFRQDGIPLVATEDYQIFVPCPETEEEAGKASLDDLGGAGAAAFGEGAVLVDARAAEAYAAGHIPGAVSVEYDELEGVEEDAVERLKGMAGVTQYIVYCDGWPEEEDPALRYAHPPSEHLADELKSMGLEKVISLEGGLRAYRDSGGRMEQ